MSRFPSSDVDLALVVADDVPADQVEEALRAAGGPLLESVALFDVVAHGRRAGAAWPSASGSAPTTAP